MTIGDSSVFPYMPTGFFANGLGKNNPILVRVAIRVFIVFCLVAMGSFCADAELERTRLSGSISETNFSAVLGTTNMEWRTGGDVDWVAQTSVAHDDSGAAQAKLLGPDQESWIETSITGPGTLSFWWYSMQGSYGFYSVYVDGQEVKTCGEGWINGKIELLYGVHQVRWVLVSGYAWIEVAGYLDQVAWESKTGGSPPRLTMIPHSLAGMAGQTNAVLAVNVDGEAVLNYQWLFNGIRIRGATNATLVLSNLEPSFTGDYSVTADNVFGMSTSDVVRVMVDSLPLGECLGSRELDWSLTDSNAWFGQPFFAADGVSAAVCSSTNLGPLQLVVDGPGTLQFSWFSQDMGIKLTMDDRTIVDDWPTGSWRPVSVNVPFGRRVLKWRSSNQYAGGRAYVDCVRFTPLSGVAPSIVEAPRSEKVWAGDSLELSVVACGSPQLTYQWMCNGRPIYDEVHEFLRIDKVSPGLTNQYTVVVSNLFGVVESDPVAVEVVSVSVGRALNCSNLEWSVLSDYKIYGQTNSTHDGDAALEFNNSHYWSEGLRTKVTGPGILEFWQTAQIRFSVDSINRVVPFIGNGWQKESIVIGEGEHILEWGGDYGLAWVDEVSWKPLQGSSPRILSSPSSQIVTQSSNVILTCEVSGAPLFLQWMFNSKFIKDATNATLLLENVGRQQVGYYALIASNCLGCVSSTPALLKVSGMSVGEAVGATDLEWHTNSDVITDWYGQTNKTHDGVAAACSPDVLGGGKSSMAVQVVGPAQVRFWWSWDLPIGWQLSVAIDSQSVQSRSVFDAGDLWECVEVEVPVGSHLLEWEITAPPWQSAYVGKGYVDELTVIPAEGEPPVLTKQPQLQVVSAGQEALFSVDVQGSGPIWYQWRSGGTNIPGATNAIFSIPAVSIENAGFYEVVVSNYFGTAASVPSFLIVQLNMALQDALDSTNLTIGMQTEGWFGQNAETHDNVDAAEAIGSGILQISVVGPGFLSFWWKTGSDSQNQLGCYIDNQIRCSAASDGKWHKEIIAVSGGPHEINFQCQGWAEPLARAFLDELCFVPDSGCPPQIVRQPRNTFVEVEQTATFEVVAKSTSPLTYQWKYNGDSVEVWEVDGATNSTLSVEVWDESALGKFSVVVANPFGQVESTPALLGFKSNVGDAIGYPGTWWSQDESNPWTVDKTVKHDGVSSMRSGKIEDLGYSSLSTQVKGPGSLSFWWKVSSEAACDFLSLYVNDELRLEISGNTDWKKVTIPIQEDSCVSWLYSKDDDNARGADCGWVDQMTFVPSAPPVIRVQPRDLCLVEGTTEKLRVEVDGAGPFKYTWSIDGQDYEMKDASLKLCDARVGYHQISLRVENGFGAAVSRVATVQIKPRTTIDDQVAVEGTTVRMRVNTVGSQTKSYEWVGSSKWGWEASLDDENRFQGIKTPILTVKRVSLDDYIDGYGCNVRYSGSQKLYSDWASLFVVPAGEVVAWGDVGVDAVPEAATNVVAISVGAEHYLALRDTGTVVGWGNNGVGQIDIPSGLENVIAVAAGTYHSLAVRTGGSVVAWGGNWDGQADVPLGLSNVLAISAGASHSLALKEDGTVVAWGKHVHSGQPAYVPPGLSNIIAVAAGSDHDLALTKEGKVVAWGDPNYCAGASGLKDVKAIATGPYHSLALKKDGSVVAWGNNLYGQTSVPQGLKHVKAIAAGETHSMALTDSGKVVAWGACPKDEWGPPVCDAGLIPAGLGQVTSIAAGYRRSLAIVSSPMITEHPVSCRVVVGENVTLRSRAKGRGPLSYQWRFNNRNIVRATNSSFTIPSVQRRDAGNYSVVVTNSSGSVVSDSAKLTVSNTKATGNNAVHDDVSEVDGDGGLVLSTQPHVSGVQAVSGLSMERVGTNVLISWPNTIPGLQLETTDDLTKSFGLNGVPQVLLGDDQVNRVVIPAVDRQRFYRLHKP